VEARVVDVVVSGTPVDLTQVLTVDVPVVRARYELREQVPGGWKRPFAGSSLPALR
jgi:predicted GTPase